MVTQEQTARREHYRVLVPESEFIVLESEGTNYRVREISEQGIRFESQSELDADQWVRGTIRYGLDESIAVSTQVIRSEKGEDGSPWTIVAKVFNLPMSKVVSFQSYLVRTYGSISADADDQQEAK